MNMPNLAELPALPLSRRDELPDLPGVYFALDASGRPIYIGKAKSLCKRWKSTSHHRYSQLAAMSGIRLAWLALSTPDLLDGVEEACINHFRPTLNDTGIIYTTTRPYRVRLNDNEWEMLDRIADYHYRGRGDMLRWLIKQEAKRLGLSNE